MFVVALYDSVFHVLLSSVLAQEMLSMASIAQLLESNFDAKLPVFVFS